MINLWVKDEKRRGNTSSFWATFKRERDKVSFSRRSRDVPIRKSMRGELNAATHNDRTLYDIVHFVWQFVRAKMPRRGEARNGGRAVCNLPPGTNAQTHIYTYSRVHVCAYTCPIPNKGAHIEGLAVAGYIGGCGVNNTSRSSYIGDLPAWLWGTCEREQEKKLIKQTLFSARSLSSRCAHKIRFVRLSNELLHFWYIELFNSERSNNYRFFEGKKSYHY